MTGWRVNAVPNEETADRSGRAGAVRRAAAGGHRRAILIRSAPLWLATLCAGAGWALEQTWEDPKLARGNLTLEEIDKCVRELGADKYAVRAAAAEKLLCSQDLRVLTRLRERAEREEDPEVVQRIRQLLPEMHKRLSDSLYFSDFHVLGPFPLNEEERAAVDDWRNQDCLFIPTGLDKLKTIDLKAEVPLRPDQEAGGPKVKWRRPHPDGRGVLELTALHPEHKEFAHVFLLTFIHSDAEAQATLHLGSDDGLAVWVNGRCVFYGDYHRAVVKDSDQATVKLSKGWNPMLFRVSQGYGGWAFSLRISDAGGRPWPDRKVNPVCNGETLPAIPAPVNLSAEEKAQLPPRAGNPEWNAVPGFVQPPRQEEELLIQEIQEE